MIRIEPLYRRLFGQEIPGPVLEQFQRACELDLVGLSARDRRILRAIEQRRLDPLAVEFALRRIDASNGLTRMLRLLSYLTEVLGHHPQFYVVRPRPPLLVLMACLGELIRSAWRLVKGHLQLRGLKHV